MLLVSMGETDEELMQSYGAGNAGAFERLYKRHKGSLYRYLLRQISHTDIVDEIYQDVWMQLIRHKHNYRPKAKFKTYLFHIAHNKLIDYYRWKNRSVPVSHANSAIEQQLDNPKQGPMHSVARGQTVNQILSALNKLPEAQREAWLLKEECGLTASEIAEATGVSVETAKSRLRYAVSKLRQELMA